MRVGLVARCKQHVVKSMVGEDLRSVYVSNLRVGGDRLMAVVNADGRVVTAGKSAPKLLLCRARLAGDALDPNSIAVVTMPDGTNLTSDSGRLPGLLSELLGEPVRLVRVGADEIWRKISGKPMPPGTFVDESPVHLVTTASLEHLRSLSGVSAFEDDRFRYNFLIETLDGLEGFIEDGWLGRTLQIGGVRLLVKSLTGRCLVTTRASIGLAENPEVLSAIRQANRNCLGVRLDVLETGLVKVGDSVELM